MWRLLLYLRLNRIKEELNFLKKWKQKIVTILQHILEDYK